MKRFGAISSKDLIMVKKVSRFFNLKKVVCGRVLTTIYGLFELRLEEDFTVGNLINHSMFFQDINERYDKMALSP